MITRRQLLQIAGCAAAAIGAPPAGAASLGASLVGAPPVSAAGARGLVLRHLVTGERLEVELGLDGYLSAAIMGRIETLMRDPATDARGHIDPQLIRRLLQTAVAWTPWPVYDVLDAYRSASRAAGAGLHAQGRAIDLRLSGVACADLAASAVALGQGGVGYYRAADFVHLDTGAPRRWQG